MLKEIIKNLTLIESVIQGSFLKFKLKQHSLPQQMEFRCPSNTCLQQPEISLSLNNSFNNKEMLTALSLLVQELEWNP